MADAWTTDVETRLSEINVRLIEDELSDEEHMTLVDEEDRLLARQKTYKTTPTGGDRGAIVQGLKDELNATQERLAALDATPPAEVRAEAIGRLHVRDDGADLTELLIELEEKEWARQWFVERLRK